VARCRGDAHDQGLPAAVGGRIRPASSASGEAKKACDLLAEVVHAVVDASWQGGQEGAESRCCRLECVWNLPSSLALLASHNNLGCRTWTTDNAATQHILTVDFTNYDRGVARMVPARVKARAPLWLS